MLRFAPLLLLLACADHHPPLAAPVCEPTVRAPSAAASAPTLDEAGARAKAQEFLDAYDRADAATALSMLGASFLRADLARFYPAKWLEADLTARAERHAPTRSRTWKDAHVQTAPGIAIVMVETVVHVPGEGDSPAIDVDQWNELTWTFDTSSWKLVHWAVRAGGEDAEREAWNITLRQGVGFRTAVNQFLADWAKGKKPGTALDLSAGQGRNAVWLATQGWQVTALDISDVGLEIAKKAALAKKVKLTTVEADADTWDLGKEKWDLITLIYAGSNHALIERIKPAIKKGGWFVVEFFGKDTTAGTGIGGFAPGELAAMFAGWKIEKDEVTDGVADWGLRKGKVARFAAQKP